MRRERRILSIAKEIKRRLKLERVKRLNALFLGGWRYQKFQFSGGRGVIPLKCLKWAGSRGRHFHFPSTWCQIISPPWSSKGGVASCLYISSRYEKIAVSGSPHCRLQIPQVNTGSAPYPPGAPSRRGGHRVLCSGCRRGRRFAERLQGCRHFPENS